MIETRNLVKAVNTSEGRLIILNGVSLLIESGEAVAIVGASGSGKSTLLGLMAGLDGVTSGDVLLDGHNLTQMDEEQRAILRGQLVGFVFQSFQLLPSLTALENVMLPIELKGDPEPNKKANQLLERVGLEERWHHYPNQLSGGEQQRVAIARALCMEPRIMLFDEPTSALDPEMINEVLDVMVELVNTGMTMICVTHEMGFARKVADKMVFMDHGEIVEMSEPEKFFTAPESNRCQTFLNKILHH